MLCSIGSHRIPWTLQSGLSQSPVTEGRRSLSFALPMERTTVLLAPATMSALQFPPARATGGVSAGHWVTAQLACLHSVSL